MSIEDTIRSAVREEVRAALKELRGAAPEPRKLLTVEEVAAHCAVKAETVRTWIRAGRLATVPKLRPYRVTLAALDAFITADDSKPVEQKAEVERMMALLRRAY